jgi:DNA repair exonuclease SbcCD ATPase subunit
MTDKEIIRALECCCDAELKSDCIKLKCPFFDYEIHNCKNEDENVMYRFALALINRQQAEVEKLELLNASLTDSCDGYIKAVNTYRAEIERLTSNIEAMAQSMPTMAKADRAEAVKEFAERLHAEIVEALQNNYEVRGQRMAKLGVGETDQFVAQCTGKIYALRGIDDFVEETYKEMVGE